MSVYYRDKNGDDTLISGMAPITNNITDGDMAAVTSNAVADALANKQNKIDNNLTTTSKTTTGAINELNSALSKHDISIDDGIDLSSYTSQQNAFICPSDGYIRVYKSSLRIGNPSFNAIGIASVFNSIFVRKGTQAFLAEMSSDGFVSFYPLT